MKISELPHHCHACGDDMSGPTSAEDNDKSDPQPGDIIVCSECGAISSYMEDMRTTPFEDWSNVPDHIQFEIKSMARFLSNYRKGPLPMPQSVLDQSEALVAQFEKDFVKNGMRSCALLNMMCVADDRVMNGKVEDVSAMHGNAVGKHIIHTAIERAVTKPGGPFNAYALVAEAWYVHRKAKGKTQEELAEEIANMVPGDDEERTPCIICATRVLLCDPVVTVYDLDLENKTITRRDDLSTGFIAGPMVGQTLSEAAQSIAADVVKMQQDSDPPTVH